jgi:hypothetical protein
LHLFYEAAHDAFVLFVGGFVVGREEKVAIDKLGSLVQPGIVIRA